MAQPTHTASTTDSPQRHRWCHWHKGPSEIAILVDAIERNSAPPIALYACAPCREQRGLVALADRP
ncbi:MULTISPECIES: hypothetical protein [unclassified Streptomyces]|uniref:hypothetical protein n=1 Tax=unclassified Streptomyces TaxID=2593676 RepID=UPI0011623124|nr:MULTISPECIES: hypothetical protein [unclassified Streptomyces]NMI54235.1 hypothetical protein [Streptomyces sp. RLA2-12]QDN63166.1 hypothetical protein FNV67_55770 [Streptomyces sp. S1D4-20]QDN73218.1 hypothetical protein FNV66_54650 [Streptomyces sp. S1D4-14]QDO55816.1 hypothetical protein FNV60_54065 [Streptomyces sp. RLB3-5]QDO56914.1 hypothetical protein FNV59_00105 [Streptomyces sp. RLB1-8]